MLADDDNEIVGPGVKIYWVLDKGSMKVVIPIPLFLIYTHPFLVTCVSGDFLILVVLIYILVFFFLQFQFE
jgi:hypothetical protein